MCNVLYENFLKGDANSHLSKSLWDDAQYLRNCPRKYAEESKSRHVYFITTKMFFFLQCKV